MMSTTASVRPASGSKPSWLKQSRRRQQPWQLQRHGERVSPPNEQRSNLTLANGQVLQMRNEPISKQSAAFALDGTGSSATD